jgi:uncharacterized protein YjiS (DUF1127 family)
MLTVIPVTKRAPATLFKAVSEKLHAWMRYREAVRQLSQLSDLELHDIGVSRGEIEYIARH